MLNGTLNPIIPYYTILNKNDCSPLKLLTLQLFCFGESKYNKIII